MKQTLVIFFIYTLTLFSAYGQDPSIEAEFITDNKKTFFQGEAIALDLIITNNTSEDISVCWYSGGELYSTTHNMGVQELEAIAPADYERPKLKYSHPIRINKSDSARLSPSRGCDFNLYNNHKIPSNMAYHFTKLLNNCIGNHSCPSGISYPLPLGQYDYTVTLSLSNGMVIIRKYEFEIIEPTPQQTLYLNRFAQIFDYDNIGATYDFIINCHDPDVKSKAITWIYKSINNLDNSSLTFWKNHIEEINYNALLIQQLKQFVNGYGDNDKLLNKLNTDRATVYNDLLIKLQNKDLVVSEALISSIESKNLYSEDIEFYEPIPQESLRRMRLLYIINKKRKERQD